MALRRKKWVRWIVSWLPHRLTIGVRSLLRLQHLVVAKVRYRWHRSLQLRVVGTTLVISATVIAVLGFFLTEQIDQGLVLNAESSARTQVLAGLNTARAQTGLTTEPANGAAAGQFMTSLGNVLQPSSSGSTRYYLAVGLNASLASKAGYPQWTHHGFRRRARCRRRCSTTSRPSRRPRYPTASRRACSTTPRPRSRCGNGQGKPAIVVGAPLGDWYQLYYFFPLDNEQQTLQLVQTTLIGAGIALVALLAAIASLVTRWVVLPVRHAARAAQRVAAGRLEERMAVGGKDDLGALATSFNDMAASLQEKLQELEELSKAQRQFVSDVSHELRTPMTTIRMAAEILFESREELDPAVGPVSRAAAEPDRAVRDPAHRPARDEQARRERGHAGRRARRTSPISSAAAPTTRSSSRSAAAAASSSGCPPRPAWPRSTGAGWSGSCATCWSTRWSTARDGTSW